MAIWLIRAGKYGEYELKTIQESKVYVTWDDLNIDLAKLDSRSRLTEEIIARYPDAKPKTIANWVGQIWPFAHDIMKGDLVILPLKSQRAIQIGEITGNYQFESKGPNPFFHWRSVKWIGEAIPRANFGKDLLNTFGAFLTICRVQRNNAEDRINAMRKNGWKPETIGSITKIAAAPNLHVSDIETEDIDIEEAASDQIARLITARFKGHGLTRLVEGIPLSVTIEVA